MAHLTCENFIQASVEVPLLHFRGKDTVVMGKLITVSELLLKANYVEVQQYLTETFCSADQIFVVPSINDQDLSLSMMSVEQIDNVVLKKQSNEVRPIIPENAKEEWDILKAAFNSVPESEKPTIENNIRSFAHRYILEAIAANALKKIAIYSDPVVKKPFLLLDNRKVFTSDKTKVKTAANRAGNSMARAMLQSTKKTDVQSSPAGKPGKQIQEVRESDVESSEESYKPSNQNSDSEIEEVSSKSLPIKVIEVPSGSSTNEEWAPTAKESVKKASKSAKHTRSKSPIIPKKKHLKKSAPQVKQTVSIKKGPSAGKLSKKSTVIKHESEEDSSSSDSSDFAASEQVF